MIASSLTIQNHKWRIRIVLICNLNEMAVSIKEVKAFPRSLYRYLVNIYVSFSDCNCLFFYEQCIWKALWKALIWDKFIAPNRHQLLYQFVWQPRLSSFQDRNLRKNCKSFKKLATSFKPLSEEIMKTDNEEQSLCKLILIKYFFYGIVQYNIKVDFHINLLNR